MPLIQIKAAGAAVDTLPAETIWDFNMSAADNLENKQTPPAENRGGSEKYVMAIVVAIMLGLGAYQLFFCPDCYAMTDRTSVQSTTD